MADTIATILISLDTVCNLCCRVPQIVRLVRLKESQALSVYYWIFCIMSCLCYTSYCFIKQLWFPGAEAVMNGCMNIIVLVLTIKYRKNRILE